MTKLEPMDVIKQGTQKKMVCSAQTC